jgi:hypothetical protein
VSFSFSSSEKFVEIVSEVTKVLRTECVNLLQEEGESKQRLQYVKIYFTFQNLARIFKINK